MHHFLPTRYIVLTLGMLFILALCGCVPRLPLSVKVYRAIPYAQVGDQTLRLDLYVPRKPAGKLPVVVWIHGGAWNSGSRKHCPIGRLARNNLAVVSIDYRLTEVAPFPAQLYDCKGAIRWLRAHAEEYDLATNRIGIFGASAGGHLALLLATTMNHPALEGTVGGNLNFSSRVSCVCALYPPTDLNRLVSDPQMRMNPDGDVAKLIGGAVALHLDQAREASPLTYVDHDCAPVFLVHGGADELVPPGQSQLFYAACQQAGVESYLRIIPGKGHGMIPPKPVADQIIQFFRNHLLSQSQLKSLN